MAAPAWRGKGFVFTVSFHLPGRLLIVCGYAGGFCRESKHILTSTPKQKHQTAASRNLHPNELASDCTMKVACSKQFRILLLLPALSFSWLACFWPCLHWAVRAKEGDSEDGLRRACGLSLQVSMNANHFQSYSIIIKFSLLTS